MIVNSMIINSKCPRCNKLIKVNELVFGSTPTFRDDNGIMSVSGIMSWTHVDCPTK